MNEKRMEGEQRAGGGGGQRTEVKKSRMREKRVVMRRMESWMEERGRVRERDLRSERREW